MCAKQYLKIIFHYNIFWSFVAIYFARRFQSWSPSSCGRAVGAMSAALRRLSASGLLSLRPLLIVLCICFRFPAKAILARRKSSFLYAKLGSLMAAKWMTAESTSGWGQKLTRGTMRVMVGWL